MTRRAETAAAGEPHAAGRMAAHAAHARGSIGAGHGPSLGVVSAILVALAASGCGGGDDGPTGPGINGGGSSSVSLTPGAAQLSAIGATQQYSANAEDENGSSIPDSQVDWSSTDESVATVDGNGLATAQAAGQTDIVASVDGAADTASLSVNPLAASVTVTPAEDTIHSVGDTLRLTAEADDSNGNPVDDADFDWSSSDAAVATVDSTGLVRAEAEGDVEIVAFADGAADTAAIAVRDPNQNASPVASISSPQDGGSFGEDEDVDLVGSATDIEDGTLTGGSLVWESSVDGQLGTGASLTVSGLSLGDHTIVLTATDSNGASGSDSVDITIEPQQNLRGSVSLIHNGVLTTETVEAVAVAENTGDEPTGAFDWTLSVDGNQVAAGRSQGVAALDTLTVTREPGLGPFAEGTHQFALELDTGDEVPEFDETDNSASARLESYPAGFEIEFQFVSAVDSATRDIFLDAGTRWSELITGDLPDMQLSQSDLNNCVQGAGQGSSLVDDVLILVEVDSIDGAGGTLGRAGPCLVRAALSDSQTEPDTILTAILGAMVFDEADVDQLQSQGQFDEVILHEMGHVIGVGTLWPFQDLLVGRGGSDPIFTGRAAIEAFLGVGGDQYAGEPVPVENMGGSGTRDAHWREVIFDNELMTGFLNQNMSNPLSVVSIASLGDQFYAVDTTAADPFQLQLGGAARFHTGSGTIHLGDDLLRAPLYGVDTQGRVRRIHRHFRP